MNKEMSPILLSSHRDQIKFKSVTVQRPDLNEELYILFYRWSEREKSSLSQNSQYVSRGKCLKNITLNDSAV